MKKKNICNSIFLIVALLIVNIVIVQAQRKNISKPKYKLVWHDEFSDTTLDPEKWVFSRWSPLCTDKNFLAYVKDGMLILKTIKNPNINDANNKKYIAGCVETKGKQSFLYGKLEIRARFKNSQGSWPAIWLKPVQYRTKNDWTTTYGEIDIMEHLNKDPFTHITVHSYNRKFKVKDTPKFHSIAQINSDKFNTYKLEWDKNNISI